MKITKEWLKENHAGKYVVEFCEQQEDKEIVSILKKLNKINLLKPSHWLTSERGWSFVIANFLISNTLSKKCQFFYLDFLTRSCWKYYKTVFPNDEFFKPLEKVKDEIYKRDKSCGEFRISIRILEDLFYELEEHKETIRLLIKILEEKEEKALGKYEEAKLAFIATEVFEAAKNKHVLYAADKAEVLIGKHPIINYGISLIEQEEAK